MIREIKFRGLSDEIHGGAMVEGCGFHAPTNTLSTGINQGYEIDPTTLGQYTGLKDANGVEIYEGDVVKWHVNDHDVTGTVNMHAGMWDLMKPNGWQCCCWDHLRGESTVIGNIHENPELLDKALDATK